MLGRYAEVFEGVRAALRCPHRSLAEEEMQAEYVSKQILPFCRTRIPQVSKMEASNPNKPMIRKNQSYASAVFIWSQRVRV